MTKIIVDKLVLEQVMEALKCVDLQSLVPDYGSGHYSVARSDGPQVKSAITVMEAALAEPVEEPVQLREHCLWARNGNEPCPHVQQAEPTTKESSAAEPVEEPVAWIYEFYADMGHKGLAFEEQPSAYNTPLYAHPPAEKTTGNLVHIKLNVMRTALENILGTRPIVDNLLSDKDIARTALERINHYEQRKN